MSGHWHIGEIFSASLGTPRAAIPSKLLFRRFPLPALSVRAAVVDCAARTFGRTICGALLSHPHSMGKIMFVSTHSEGGEAHTSLKFGIFAGEIFSLQIYPCSFSFSLKRDGEMDRAFSIFSHPHFRSPLSRFSADAPLTCEQTAFGGRTHFCAINACSEN
jgi:hypothetical protein